MRRGCFDESLANHSTAPNKRKPVKKTKKQLAAQKSRQKLFALRTMPYAKYLESAHWKRKRAKALKTHGAFCAKCKRKDDLHVHHLTYERKGCEAMADLQVLCGGCHREAHAIDGVNDLLTREFLQVIG